MFVFGVCAGFIENLRKQRAVKILMILLKVLPTEIKAVNNITVKTGSHHLLIK